MVSVANNLICIIVFKLMNRPGRKRIRAHQCEDDDYDPAEIFQVPNNFEAIPQRTRTMSDESIYLTTQER